MAMNTRVITSENFFIGTYARFKACKRPMRRPDYISRDRKGNVSSVYWYTVDGVIRASDHWTLINSGSIREDLFECGNVASCQWILCGAEANGVGFCKFNNFKEIKIK